jgi:hypothetical protein
MPFLAKMPAVTPEKYETLVRALFDRAAAAGCGGVLNPAECRRPSKR